MGNSDSTSNKVDTQRVQQIAKEVLGVFSRELPVWYKFRVIEELRKGNLGDIQKITAPTPSGEATSEVRTDIPTKNWTNNPQFVQHKWSTPTKGSPANQILLPLMQAPLASTLLKRGMLIKQGDQFHTWRERWFHVYHEDRNYLIVYTEDEKGLIEKGTINCGGYVAKIFNEEEETLWGQFGITLTSKTGSSNRQWRLRAKSYEDREEWLEIFNLVCRKVDPSSLASDSSSTLQGQQRGSFQANNTNYNRILSLAFHDAYRYARQVYGLFGYYQPNLDECQLLEILVTSIILREIHVKANGSANGLVGGVYGNGRRGSGGGGRSGSGIRDFIHSADDKRNLRRIERIVKPLVESVWRSRRDAIQVLEESFIKHASDIFSQIVEQERIVCDRLFEPVSALVEPCVNNIVSRLCAPFLEFVAPVVVEAYEESLRGLNLSLRQKALLIDFKGGKYQDYFQVIQPVLEAIEIRSDGGSIGTSKRVLRQLVIDSDIDAILCDSRAGISGEDLFEAAMEIVCKLCRNVVWTFGQHAVAFQQQQSGSTRKAHLVSVTSLGGDDSDNSSVLEPLSPTSFLKETTSSGPIHPKNLGKEFSSHICNMSCLDQGDTSSPSADSNDDIKNCKSKSDLKNQQMQENLENCPATRHVHFPQNQSSLQPQGYHSAPQSLLNHPLSHLPHTPLSNAASPLLGSSPVSGRMRAGSVTRRSLVDLLNMVITSAAAEAKIAVRETVLAFLHLLIEPFVQELLLLPATEMFRKKKSIIKKGDLTGVLSVTTIGFNMIRTMVDDVLLHLIEDLVLEASMRIDLTLERLQAYNA